MPLDPDEAATTIRAAYARPHRARRRRATWCAAASTSWRRSSCSKMLGTGAQVGAARGAPRAAGGLPAARARPGRVRAATRDKKGEPAVQALLNLPQADFQYDPDALLTEMPHLDRDLIRQLWPATARAENAPGSAALPPPTRGEGRGEGLLRLLKPESRRCSPGSWSSSARTEPPTLSRIAAVQRSSGLQLEERHGVCAQVSATSPASSRAARRPSSRSRPRSRLVLLPRYGIGARYGLSVSTMQAIERREAHRLLERLGLLVRHHSGDREVEAQVEVACAPPAGRR